ncbi:3-oxoacyl-[acyl-carrier-protein] synthase III C-terminal domain-containing protein [Catellatospora coxensis]|uniref:3-oxoacyl-[acyl-carrier-protein] synthase 3 n=1 Tax=Catellatospora coxensis TaxID=310354 RepID=A0A8J3P6X2_9ACTN|nr:3-oxoacyl-[acyl-carrier-protein] synthase III C-terminal domain-containing protein [Catellatospora coxensis]GIG03971.1 3-oxoacyl-[acyl-carrier-protein] synthase 3 [Catellatospora coxensis]
MDGLYIGSFAHALGARKRHLRESAEAGLLRSAPEDLEAAGFRWHHICEPDGSAYDLARSAVAEIAARGELTDIDAIVYATCLPDGGTRTGPVRDVKELMDFPAGRLQAEFGLSRAIVVGLHQQACTGVLGALRVAGALLTTEPGWRRVLCVTADRFPDGAWYEQAYNLISDGAAACVVGREPDVCRLLTVHQITNGGLGRAGDDETVGTYFAYTHRLVREAAARVGLAPAELDWVVTQNTNDKAWQILARLLGVDHARVWAPTLPDVGHVISADPVVNLSALLDSGRARPGQRIALPMAGFGLNWQCAVLEVVGR